MKAFGQPPGAASISSICLTMPFHNGDFGGRIILDSGYLMVVTGDWGMVREGENF